MVDYLSVAKNIQHWLADLQISQKEIQAKIQDNLLTFPLQHPEKGTIKVVEELPGDTIFRCQDVAFEVVDNEGDELKLRVYDYGGIWDPIDKRVMGEHYSTSHFALLSALLYGQTLEEKYLQQALRAFEFHRFTSAHEYVYSEWMYHWDFQNYALIECFDILKDVLDEDTRYAWEQTLKKWKSNFKNKLSNWAAMRALAFYKRFKLFNSWIDYLLFQWHYSQCLKGEQPDGCFDDDKNLSRPIQYHIYGMALLHRLYLLNRKKVVGDKFLKGIEFFMPFIDPDGDFNYWGRGHGQIFGYGAGIYALTAAALMTGEKKYHTAAKKLFDYLLAFQCNGHFPLVLNIRPDQEQCAWYDYHHTTVYNAFLGVWLAFAHELQTAQKKTPQLKSPAAPKVASSNFAFISNDNFFVAVGKGLPHYSSEVGLSPCHIWVKNIGWLYSCPGGPTPETFGKKFGDENILKNFMAPILIAREKKIYTPAGCPAPLQSSTDDQIHCLLEYRIGTVKRVIQLLDDEIHIFDSLLFLADMHIKELRFFNFPVVTDKFEYKIQREKLMLSHSGSKMTVHCAVPDFELVWENLESIRTVKGLARVLAMRVKDIYVQNKDKFAIETRIVQHGVRPKSPVQPKLVTAESDQ
ncbi:MAG: hypothetical protein ACE5HS_00365 [bacterium]